jgi:hypothetical protein
VVGIDRVAQSETIGQERGTEQHGAAMEGRERPPPGEQVRGDQDGVERDHFKLQRDATVIKQRTEPIHSAT